MARVEYQDRALKTYGASPEELTFYLVTAGTTVVPTFGFGMSSNVLGTIVRTGTGAYTVPLTLPVFKVIRWDACVDDIATPDFSWVTLGPFLNEGTATPLSFTMNTVTPSVATDLVAGRKIRIGLRVQRSDWGRMK